VKDYYCSAKTGSSVTSLAHSSEYKSYDHFRDYPKASEHKQNSRQKRSITATNTPKKIFLMEKKRLSKGKGPKTSLFKNKEL
jgi:hypothetical protein